MESLNVYLCGRPVGKLCDDNGTMFFAYSEEYLASGCREPLSYSLPLRAEPYSQTEIEPFLSGLLPDDIIRTRLGRLLQIPRENTFAFLRAIGGDCAGAIAFFEGDAPRLSEPSYRRLSDAEAGRILDNLEKRPLDIGEDGFRISGAGAQDKLIACFDRKGVFLPLEGTPSTHIIKTAIPGFPDSVENECFSMKLAAACGLKAAKCQMALIGGRRRFVCERYDRESTETGVRRLHQEDLCQMLGVDPKRKYESLGGPGVSAILKLFRELGLPAPDTLAFIDGLIFNFLLGNGDAHGKNFSILYRDGVGSMAPMYDLMSTAVYPEVSQRLAMKIDGEYSFKWITRNKFLRLAEKDGIAPRLMEKHLDRMARKIIIKAETVAARLKKDFPSDCYRRIIDGIQLRVNRITER